MAKQFGVGSIWKSAKKKRPGVHAKTKLIEAKADNFVFLKNSIFNSI